MKEFWAKKQDRKWRNSGPKTKTKNEKILGQKPGQKMKKFQDKNQDRK
jgi:hypothetical protein